MVAISRITKKRVPSKENPSATSFKYEKTFVPLGSGEAINTPAGKVLVPANADKNAEQYREQKKKSRIESAVLAETEQKQIENAALQRVAQEQANINAEKNRELLSTNLTPEQQTRNVVPNEPIPEAIGTTVAGIGGTLAGAGAGAAAVAPISAGLAATGVGAIPAGAIVAGGAIIGAFGSVFSKIGIEKRQDVKQALVVANTANQNMNWILNQVNSGRMSGQQAREMWDEEVSNILSAERNLKKETSTQLKRFLSGGADELTKVQSKVKRLPIMEEQLNLAIIQPDPLRVIVEPNYNLEE
jgi:hypothetical protein